MIGHWRRYHILHNAALPMPEESSTTDKTQRTERERDRKDFLFVVENTMILAFQKTFQSHTYKQKIHVSHAILPHRTDRRGSWMRTSTRINPYLPLAALCKFFGDQDKKNKQNFNTEKNEQLYLKHNNNTINTGCIKKIILTGPF